MMNERGTPVGRMPLEDIEPCKGSGKPWDVLRPRMWVCPECDAGPATLRVPNPWEPGENMPTVPGHPDMVVWTGRIDVTQWRVTRSAMRPAEQEEQS